MGSSPVGTTSIWPLFGTETAAGPDRFPVPLPPSARLSAMGAG